MLFSRDYIEFDPAKKDKKWASRLISEFRAGAYNPLYPKAKAKENRDIIDSEQSMDKIKKMFADPKKMEDAGFEFIPISIIEKIKNILIGEKWKEEIKAYVDSQDPALVKLKKEDKNLLKNKKLIDNTVNRLKAKIGLPPENIGNDDFNGNYTDFEAMGFEQSEQMDIETFFETFYQLDTEIDLQKIINHVFYVNSVEDDTYDFCNDIFSTKSLAIQTFVNKLTGGITVKRLIPENVFRVKGSEKTNQKTDLAVGFYETVTVPEFLKRAGDDFDFNRDFIHLLQGLNNSPKQYTSITFEDGTKIGEGPNSVTYSTLMTYNVEIGYIEHKSIDCDQYKKFENKLGNTKVYEIDDTIKNKNYQLVSDFRERTYASWFLVVSNIEQYVYNSGLLYHQETEGQEDEIASFSIKYIQFDGKTLAEVAKPWIIIAQEAFTKFRFLLREAKKDGRQWNLESLIEVSKKFFTDDGGPAGLQSTIEMFENSANEIYSMPLDREGQPVPIQGGVNFAKPNELDSKFTSYKSIIEWGLIMIKNDIGINDLREGANPTTNDVYKLEKASLESSSNATMYMNTAFDYIYKNNALSVLSIAMDIIRFKDTLPYKYLLNILGEEGMKRMEALPKISLHRQDIYVSSFASYKDRIKVLQDTEMAFQKGAIDYATKVLIDNTNNHRKAQKLLVIKEQKAIKLKQKEVEQQQKNAMALEKMKTDNQILIINTKGQWEVKKAQVQTEGYVRSAQINAQARSEIQTKKGDDEKAKEIIQHQLEQQDAFNS